MRLTDYPTSSAFAAICYSRGRITIIPGATDDREVIKRAVAQVVANLATKRAQCSPLLVLVLGQVVRNRTCLGSARQFSQSRPEAHAGR
jgi:hypothetical protein